MAGPIEQFEWLVAIGRGHLRESAAIESWGKLAAWQKLMLNEQLSFRKRACRRFPAPENWLWTDRSLSQASDWVSAVFKASLVPRNTRVMDACCGAGADLVALAERGTVHGVDLDPVMCLLAKTNLESHELSGDINCADFLKTHLHSDVWLHIDPDRRATGARSRKAEDFQPAIEAVLAATNQCAGTIVKLAPQTDFEPDTAQRIDADAVRAWLGNGWECRQQLAAFGEARQILEERTSASSQHRIAVLAFADQAANALPEKTEYFTSSAVTTAETLRVVDVPLSFVYELHPVLHAAEIQSAWAAQNHLTPISSAAGYFTSDVRIESPWCQRFQVLGVESWDDRKIRRALRQHRAGLVEVKNRLVKLDANAFQRRYNQPEGQPLTLLITRIGQRVKAILATRE